MRRYLLAGIGLLALTKAVHAQIPVTDAGVLGQTVQEVKQGIQQLQYWEQQIQFMESQLQQLMAVYNTLSHVTDLASAVSALGVLGIQNPLPVNVYAVQGLLQGTGGVQGMFNQIPGLFNTNFANSHVYTPTGTSFESTTLIPRAATSIAGTQALAGQLYQSMSDRLNAMVSLQARIGSGDLKDAADINTRLTAEQAYIQAQLTQATTLAMMQKAAFEDIQQQREEKRQQDIDAVIAANPDR